MKLKCYAAVINGRPVAAFHALDSDEAQTFVSEGAFPDDLLSLEDSDGNPIWDGETVISVRPATKEESKKLNDARSADSTAGDDQDDEYVIFLIEVQDPTDDADEEDDERQNV